MRKVEFTGRTHTETGAVKWPRFDVYGRHRVGERWVIVGMPTAMDGTPLADSAMWVSPTSVTWGSEKVVMRLLPLVNADGEPHPFPGTVATGRTPAGKRDHAWLWTMGSVLSGPGAVASMCGLTVEPGSTRDASWFVSDAYACKSCRRQVVRRIEAL